ncbi:imidazole glycerol phosphate synthase subunit HisF [Cellvibrio sp. KY-GH-1]|uniref:imidazole glycerol phosphate synthase subunit HisF n=1 Tax=Cellvibrio sp. KY-GH-1 TaxID=2303332 RepID=UPI001243E2A8|nr:imidazole glycerol phosphate synthase cyclase subunit [Cellvibrio sp. KY-GH-1]QEY15346.1 imidazole glycerol phosphate synthase subunit HisF [Cellvibrio sp. KY-GH-1]
MRVISRIDIKNEFVIKGIHLEGLRKVGNPNEMALRYYQSGIDEILFMDAVASLYDRNNLFHIVEAACKEIFIPITMGGGIRTLDDIHQCLQSGADKVAINTAAVHNPEIIQKASQRFGNQCVVASIEAKRVGSSWEAYIDNGREPTQLNAIDWAKKLESLGAGELLITSIDQEGTKRGFDNQLIAAVNRAVSIPVIACGGMGKVSDIASLLNTTVPSAIACASIFHYDLISIGNVKVAIADAGYPVRREVSV